MDTAGFLSNLALESIGFLFKKPLIDFLSYLPSVFPLVERTG